MLTNSQNMPNLPNAASGLGLKKHTVSAASDFSVASLIENMPGGDSLVPSLTGRTNY